MKNIFLILTLLFSVNAMSSEVAVDVDCQGSYEDKFDFETPSARKTLAINSSEGVSYMTLPNAGTVALKYSEDGTPLLVLLAGNDSYSASDVDSVVDFGGAKSWELDDLPSQISLQHSNTQYALVVFGIRSHVSMFCDVKVVE